MSDLTRSLEFPQHEVKDLQIEVKVLRSFYKEHKETIELLKARVMELEERQNYREDYNRRSNIRITGIQEQPGETWRETANTVSGLLEEKLQLPWMNLEKPIVPVSWYLLVSERWSVGLKDSVAVKLWFATLGS